jgi:hypothetical protein
MENIVEFNKSNLADLKKEIEAALSDALSKFGLKGELGNIKYESTQFNVDVVVSTPAHAGKQFAENAIRWGLKPEWFGQSFTYRGEMYTITGINPRRRKYPVIARSETGTTIGFHGETIRRLLDGAQYKPMTAIIAEAEAFEFGGGKS